MKLGKVVNYVIPILCGVLLLVIVFVTFMQIIARNFYNYSIIWSDDITQFSMSWMVLFGTIWLTKNDQHLNTGLKLHQKLSERKICLIDGILALVISITAAVVAYQSAIESLVSIRTESLSLPWIKMGYIYIMLPLAMLFICYCYLKKFFKNLEHIFKKVFPPDFPE